MNRENLEKLKGIELIAYADGLGVKVSCNRSRTSLKESKAKVIDKIIAFEESKKAEKKVDKQKNDETNKNNKSVSNSFTLPDCFSGKSSYYPKVNCYKIKRGTKTVAEIYPQKKRICVYLRSTDGTEGFNVIKDDYKYYLPVKVFVPYEEVDRLEELIYECK